MSKEFLKRMRIHARVRVLFRYVCVEKVSKGKVITKKPILPSEEEMEVNSRSKSAKLRIFERV